LGAKLNVEKISAITLKVGDMRSSVRFYKDILGLKTIYRGEGASFSSLCTDEQHTILNLEQRDAVNNWGRIISYVQDVDELWAYLKERGFNVERPRDAAWGERYFHMLDPDGHELSFAQPLE
jgi:catechol 2,3-dioxygenase-like lactoylglutathione lyase family enzyme